MNFMELVRKFRRESHVVRAAVKDGTRREVWWGDQVVATHSFADVGPSGHFTKMFGAEWTVDASPDSWDRNLDSRLYPIGELDAPVLRNALRSVAFAMSRDRTRITLQVVHLEPGFAVATDTYRLAIAPLPAIDWTGALPREGVDVLIAWLYRAKGAVQVFRSGDGVAFRHGEVTVNVSDALAARRLQYPNWRRVVPNTVEPVLADAHVLKGVGTGQRGVTVWRAGGVLRVDGRTIPMAPGSEGDMPPCGLDVRYLRQVLEHAPKGTTLGQNGDEQAFVFDAPNGWRCLLMPCRV